MSKFEKIVHQGGIFTELSLAVLADGGIVYGAAYNETWNVEHTAIEDVDQLNRLRGAKYSESNIKDIFCEVEAYLKNIRRVLFSATPCQVAGLKAFLKKDYENLYCVDFVCHGVSSPMAWKAYVEYRAKKDAEGKLPCYINLRSKDTGWSRYQYSNVFKYKDGNIYSALSSQSLFMKLFVGDYISRRSCSECKFKGYNRVSDITLGDFWGIWDIYPEMDDNKGTSVVLLQSQKGKQLWNEINDQLFFKKVTLEQASRCNPWMLKSSKANDNREKVLELIRNGKIDDCEKLFYLKSPSFKDKIKRKVRRIISKL